MLVMQRDDFTDLFKIMEGLPVTFRLLDPPLHEFLPHTAEDVEAVAAATGLDPQKLLARAKELHEVNPMLGHRGCRLGVAYPEIYEMQVRAIIEAACDVVAAGRAAPIPEIMHPLVAKGLEMKFLRELTDREKAIRELNSQLSNLRLADSMVVAPNVRPGDPLQRAVASSLPLDERIEGFDGRIVDVDERDRTAVISLPTTAGLRPGLLLAVYGPDDPRPQVGDRKAMVQITSVENATLARAVIREDDLERMILPGDGVATSLWRPGQSPEIVIVGFLDLGSGLKQSTAAINALVERSGAPLSDTVTPRTAAVVDAGPPQAADAAAGRAAVWRPADETRRKTTVDRAKALGIRVIGIDALYDLLGIDREAAGRPAAAAVAY
jgi:hypothetical protein